MDKLKCEQKIARNSFIWVAHKRLAFYKRFFDRKVSQWAKNLLFHVIISKSELLHSFRACSWFSLDPFPENSGICVNSFRNCLKGKTRHPKWCDHSISNHHISMCAAFNTRPLSATIHFSVSAFYLHATYSWRIMCHDRISVTLEIYDVRAMFFKAFMRLIAMILSSHKFDEPHLAPKRESTMGHDF